ncbi:hypothetical protein [Actinacidiphila soli]|uniref:hypothetical protein n=1 Tax=Actinacidiphila soli TaxID=2487275 RepID=UPI000FCA03A3|nr:hypothetical protein [Actinacidiphila soli]
MASHGSSDPDIRIRAKVISRHKQVRGGREFGVADRWVVGEGSGEESRVGPGGPTTTPPLPQKPAGSFGPADASSSPAGTRASTATHDCPTATATPTGHVLRAAGFSTVECHDRPAWSDTYLRIYRKLQQGDPGRDVALAGLQGEARRRLPTANLLRRVAITAC